MRIRRVRIATLLVSGSLLVNMAQAFASPMQAVEAGSGPGADAADAEFTKLTHEGFDALYSLDYQTARERFKRMTEIAPNRPAGFVYLANNIWLETLYQSRRLSSSLYSSSSFYVQTQDSDKVDPKRDREFNDLVKKAMEISNTRLKTNSKDSEALYYLGSAMGLRAGYSASVNRSFTRAIGDANESVQAHKQVLKVKPDFVDAYLSVGFYEYIIDTLPFGWRLLARMAGLKGSKKRGIEHLEMVVQQGKYANDDARVILMGIYTREGNLARALQIVDELSIKYKTNYLFGVERGVLLFRMGRREDGERLFAELVKDTRVAQTASDLVNYHWAESLVRAQDHGGAIEKYNAVIRWPKSDPHLISLSHLHSGQALDASGKREQAMVQYQIVLKRENVFDSHDRASKYLKKPFAPTGGS